MHFFQSGRRGSNPRPEPWQGSAQPTALRPRNAGEIYRIMPALAQLQFYTHFIYLHQADRER